VHARSCDHEAEIMAQRSSLPHTSLSSCNRMLRNIGTAVALTRYPRELHAYLHACMLYAPLRVRSTPLSIHLAVGFDTESFLHPDLPPLICLASISKR